MGDINLHSIFRTLVDDETFLSKVILNDHKKEDVKKSKFDINSIVNEYNVLNVYDVQNSSLFPKDIKEIIGGKYMRLGIVNIMEKNSNRINISFLNSLNQILRIDIRHLSVEEHCKNVGLLENFIIHKIKRNYNIDKMKRTKLGNIKNKELIAMLDNGKISHDTVQYIVNIFEINLIVFDLIKSEYYFYWQHGTKHPYLNLFKPLHMMAYVNGNYEPIVHSNKNVSMNEINNKIYAKILDNPDRFIFQEPIALHFTSLYYLKTWDNINITKIIVNYLSEFTVDEKLIMKQTLDFEKYFQNE